MAVGGGIVRHQNAEISHHGGLTPSARCLVRLLQPPDLWADGFCRLKQRFDLALPNRKVHCPRCPLWYDAAGRVTTSADYGSGDTSSGAGQWKYASLPTRPTSAPTASSNSALVTLYGYNADSGLRELVTDPMGTPNKTFYDRLGRVQYIAQNYSVFNGSTGTGTGNPTDVVIQRVYDGPARLQKLVALDPNGDGNQSDNQATTYLYEDEVDATRRTNEIFPDSTDTTSSGTNQIKLAYNVDGGLSQRTDQRGTVIAYNYANNRLLANQSVSTLGTGVDGAVQSIALTYDNLNRKQNVTSYASPGGLGTVVNDVQFAYNDSSQIVTTYQSHSGAVNTSTSPNVQYTYDATLTGSIFSSQHRLQMVVYPNGRTVYYDYGPSGSAYNALSQVRTIWDTNTSGTALATYSYNGAGSRLAMVNLPQPSLMLNLFQGTSGTYAGLDRFGRVVDQYWQGYGSTADADRVRYAYDYSGGRIYRDIDAAIYSTNNMDQAYGYDGLHRLTSLQQGTLSGSTISGTPTNEEDWSLDGLRNWPTYVQTTAGTTTLDQTRTVTSANEISGVSASVGSVWTTPAYDSAGNMTTIPEPVTPTTGYTATYDAWNRLVQLVDATSGNTVQQNQYDGRNFRTIILSYSGGSLSETRHSYFTEDWQCIEERVGTSTVAERQFVWGARYIDDILLRDRGSERLYALQDAAWHVTSISDATGVVKERYAYSGYGTPAFLGSTFGGIGSSNYAWETLYCGYRYDSASQLYLVRSRYYHPQLGAWCQRDQVGYLDGANLYSAWFVPHLIDPFGESGVVAGCGLTGGGSAITSLFGDIFGGASLGACICNATCAGVGGCVAGAITGAAIDSGLGIWGVGIAGCLGSAIGGLLASACKNALCGGPSVGNCDLFAAAGACLAGAVGGASSKLNQDQINWLMFALGMDAEAFQRLCYPDKNVNSVCCTFQGSLWGGAWTQTVECSVGRSPFGCCRRAAEGWWTCSNSRNGNCLDVVFSACFSQANNER
jgi:RHS repeat-associated protein